MPKYTSLPLLILGLYIGWFALHLHDTGGRPLTIVWGYDPQLFDPHQTSNPIAYEIFRHVCEPLFYVDAAGVTRGLIAEDTVTFSADGHNIHMTIRDNIHFHDGTPVTAAAVKDSFIRLRHLTISPLTTDLQNVTISTNGDFNLIFHLPSPDYGFINRVLTHGYATVQRNDPDNPFPICTGAYRFVPARYQPDIQLTIERFKAYSAHPDRYENRIAQTPEIRFRFIADREERFNALLSGDACVLSLSKEDIGRAEQTDFLHLYEDMGGVTYLGFNFAKTRWQNPHVRQAIANAIHKQALAASGPFLVADTLLTPTTHGYTDNLLDLAAQYTPDASQQQLEEVGFDFDQNVVVLIPESRTYTALFELIQSQLNEIGISNITLRAVPRTELLTMRQQYDLLIHDYAWVDFSSMQTFLTPGSNRNLLNYNRNDVADRIQDAILTADPTARDTVIQNTQQLVFEKTIYEPLIIRKIVTAVNRHCVTGESRIRFFPLNYHDATTTRNN